MPDNPFDFDAEHPQPDDPAQCEAIPDEPPTPVEPILVSAPRRDASLPEPGVLMSAAHGCLLVAAQLVAAMAVFAVAIGLGQQPDLNAVSGPLFALTLGAVVVYAVVAASLTYGRATRRYLALRGCTLFQLVLIPLTVLPVFVLCYTVANAVEHLQNALLEAAGIVHGPTPATGLATATCAALNPFEQMFEALGGLSWPMLLLVGCVFPAIGEELFFRGFIGRGLVGRLGLYVGVGLTSLAFALIHGYPPQASSALLLGITVHLLYLSTKSLLVPMVYHALHNLAAFSLGKLGDAGYLQVLDSEGLIAFPWYVILSALLAIPLLGVIWYQTRTRWLLPDGTAWAPRFLSADIPSRRLGCRPRSAWPSLLPTLAASAVYLLFAALLSSVVVGWIAKAGPTRHFKKAEEYRDLKQWDEAIAAYTTGIQASPKNAVAYSNRGFCHAHKKDYDLALKDLDEATRLDPQLGDAFNIRGWVHVERKDYASAVQDLDRAIELGFKGLDTWTQRAIAHEELGQHRQAIHDFKQAIESAPEDAHARMRLAWLYATAPDAKLRNGKLAVEHGQKACKLTNSKDPWALNALAAAHAESKNFREAVRYGEQAIILAPQADRAWYEHCLQLYREKKPYRSEP